MKLLIYEWSAFLERDLIEICRDEGLAYESFSWKFKDKNRDDAFECWFHRTIGVDGFTALLSVNYWPMLSKVCQSRGLKYIAWCYDNPLNVERVEETLANPVNYVSFFDRVQYQRYKNAGFDTVFHLPLGVNRKRMERMTISASETAKYSADVALVGKLYESQLPDIMAPLNDYTRGFLDALVRMQMDIRTCYLLDECIFDELIRYQALLLSKQRNHKECKEVSGGRLLDGDAENICLLQDQPESFPPDHSDGDSSQGV